MHFVYYLSMFILTTVVSRAETIINIYSSEKSCSGGESEKNPTVRKGVVVAFSVGRKTHFSPLKTSIMPMDHVFYNDGGYFNLNTSVFTAPVSGVYAFYFGACGHPGKQLYLQLFVGNMSKPVAMTYNYNTESYNQASGSVYKKMAKGEQAAVWLVGRMAVYGQEPPSTFFSGHLINEMP